MSMDVDAQGDVEPQTVQWLQRAALSYIDRYPTSRANLVRVLRRKLHRRGLDDAAHRMLAESLADRLCAARLVDDAQFAELRVSALKRRGASALAIRGKLMEKGVDDETAAAAMEREGHDEAAAALRYARRRGLGPFRRKDRQARHDRDIAAMMRAGFPGRVARSVVEGDGEPAEDA